MIFLFDSSECDVYTPEIFWLEVSFLFSYYLGNVISSNKF